MSDSLSTKTSFSLATFETVLPTLQAYNASLDRMAAVFAGLERPAKELNDIHREARRLGDDIRTLGFLPAHEKTRFAITFDGAKPKEPTQFVSRFLKEVAARATPVNSW